MFKIESMAIKIILLIAFVLIFIVFYAPTTIGIRNIGNIIPMAVCVAAMLFVIFNKPISKLLGNMYTHTAGKITIIAVCGFLAAGIVLVCVLSVLMVMAGNKPSDAPRTAVVLGCKVNGTTPSLMLSKRLNTAVEYLSDNDAMVIVSGGKGNNEDISEAEAMKKYLIDRGIDESRIIAEDKSASTEENIEFSLQMLEKYGLSSDITIITDGYHQLRSRMIAEKYGLNVSAVSTSTSLWLLPPYWVREWFGIVEEFCFG